MSTMLEAALAFAADGQPVFPCRNDGKHAKAPYIREGFLAASTDPAKIESWWKARPDAAIGIPTGILVDVLDVDVKNGVNGYARLDLLNRMDLLDGCVEKVRTPSGGMHLYFPVNPGKEQRNWASAESGIDFRGKGGYVLAPPSQIITENSAGAYERIRYMAGHKPLDADEVRRVLSPMTNHGASPNRQTDPDAFMFPTSLTALQKWVQGLQPGERNNGLFWAACRAIESDLDPMELLPYAVIAGLDADEATITIRSLARRVRSSNR